MRATEITAVVLPINVLNALHVTAYCRHVLKRVGRDGHIDADLYAVSVQDVEADVTRRLFCGPAALF